MVGPSYKKNEGLISAEGEREREREKKNKKKKQTVYGTASWPLNDSNSSTRCVSASHGGMTPVIKND